MDMMHKRAGMMEVHGPYIDLQMARQFPWTSLPISASRICHHSERILSEASAHATQDTAPTAPLTGAIRLHSLDN